MGKNLEVEGREAPLQVWLREKSKHHSFPSINGSEE